MKSWRMVAIVNIILISISVIIVVSGPAPPKIKSLLIIEPQKIVACLPLGKPCMKSEDPCCTLIYQQTYLELSSVPTTCFKFGKGVCQLNYSIKNFEEYSKLVRQLNHTNFQELKNKYWSTIPIAYTYPQKVIIELKSV